MNAGGFGVYNQAFTDFASDPTAQLGLQATKHALAVGNSWMGGFVRPPSHHPEKSTR